MLTFLCVCTTDIQNNYFMVHRRRSVLYIISVKKTGAQLKLH